MKETLTALYSFLNVLIIVYMMLQISKNKTGMYLLHINVLKIKLVKNNKLIIRGFDDRLTHAT